jgi:hypothetical protein
VALTEQDCDKIKMMVELGVRRYFDHYLLEVFPDQVRQVVEAHDHDSSAHGGISGQFLRFKWTLIGFVFGTGALAGTGLTALVRFLA